MSDVEAREPSPLGPSSSAFEPDDENTAHVPHKDTNEEPDAPNEPTNSDEDTQPVDSGEPLSVPDYVPDLLDIQKTLFNYVGSRGHTLWRGNNLTSIESRSDFARDVAELLREAYEQRIIDEEVQADENTVGGIGQPGDREAPTDDNGNVRSPDPDRPNSFDTGDRIPRLEANPSQPNDANPPTFSNELKPTSEGSVLTGANHPDPSANVAEHPNPDNTPPLQPVGEVNPNPARRASTSNTPNTPNEEDRPLGNLSNRN